MKWQVADSFWKTLLSFKTWILALTGSLKEGLSGIQEEPPTFMHVKKNRSKLENSLRVCIDFRRFGETENS